MNIQAEVNVIGYRYLDFTNDDGERVQGTSVYMIEDVQAGKGAGKIPVKAFLPVICDVPLGICVADCAISAAGKLKYNSFRRKEVNA